MMYYITTFSSKVLFFIFNIYYLHLSLILNHSIMCHIGVFLHFTPVYFSVSNMLNNLWIYEATQGYVYSLLSTTKAFRLTSVAAGCHWSGNPCCGWFCCNLHTWPGQRRRPAGRQTLEDSRLHRLGCPPSPAGRRASWWCPGSAPPSPPQGRTWPWVWTAEEPPSSHPGPWPEPRRVETLGGDKRRDEQQHLATGQRADNAGVSCDRRHKWLLLFCSWNILEYDVFSG